MAFAPKEIIVGATVPLANGSSITLSFAGHVEREQDCDDAVIIFSRKLLKYTNSATDEDRLTVRQVISSITSTPLDKVPDVGTPGQAPPATPDRVSPLPERMPAPEEPKPAKEPWIPKITKSSREKAQAERAAKQDLQVSRPPEKTPSTAEQAAAAVAQCVKPPVAPHPAPSAPPTPEASASAERPAAPPVARTAPAEVVCEACGAPVTKSQAKLSQLFLSKIACKDCMEAAR